MIIMEPTFVSAVYGSAPGVITPGGRLILATDDTGLVWYLNEGNNVVAWERYLAEGGTIEPFVEIPPDQIDKNELNAMMAQEGSFVRAIAEIQFLQIKGVIPVNTNITPKQYKDLIERHMRTRP